MKTYGYCAQCGCDENSGMNLCRACAATERAEKAEKERDEARDVLYRRGMSVSPDSDFPRLLKRAERAEADLAEALAREHDCLAEMARLRSDAQAVLDAVASYQFAASPNLPDSRLGRALERMSAALAGKEAK